jgi:hypothetical protein
MEVIGQVATLTTIGKENQYPTNRRLDSRADLDFLEKKNISCPCWSFELRSSL